MRTVKTLNGRNRNVAALFSVFSPFIHSTVRRTVETMSVRNAKEAALDYFAQKFNCAEATLLGLAEACELNSDCVPRIATGFGGGMGGCGEACGALVGSIMALGLRYGRERADDVAAKSAVGAKVRTLVEAFEKEFGATRCIDLTECDMRTTEGAEMAAQRKLHSDFCPRFVAFAAEITSQLID
jgi:C_GCAxxG_C_C family probable redox protein